MADLITIEDIEDAIGREAADEDESDEWQYYISVVSEYINSVVDFSFEEVTETVRLKADSYGQIKLKQPVTDVASVKNFRTGMDDLWVDFDGIDTLYFLEPHQVVDVVYSHGYASPPADIIEVAIHLVLQASGLATPASLTKYKVGDVEEGYGANRISSLVDDFVNEVLDRYRKEWYSIPLATDSFPDYRSPKGYLNDFD